MKAVPLILLAALAILPFTIRFFYTLAKSFAKDSNATAPPERQKSRTRTKLTYLAVAVYALLLVATSFWAVSSLIPELGFEEKTIIYSVITTLIIFLGLGIVLWLWFRYVRKKISLPNKEATPEAHLEWENKFADLYYRNILRILLLVVGYSLVIITLGCVIAYFLT